MIECIITGLVSLVCFLFVSNKVSNKQYKILLEETMYLRRKVFHYEIKETLEIIFDDDDK